MTLAVDMCGQLRLSLSDMGRGGCGATLAFRRARPLRHMHFFNHAYVGRGAVVGAAAIPTRCIVAQANV
eukprot:360557-Chlamydomonas_euryale.AAC.4